MLVSETEEEVVNNPGDGTVVPSRSSEPHCPIIMVYLWSYNYPHQQLHKLSFTSCHYVMSSQGLRNLTSPLPCHAPHVRCAELLWPHPPCFYHLCGCCLPQGYSTASKLHLLELLRVEDQIIAGINKYFRQAGFNAFTLTTVFLVLPRVGYCKNEGTLEFKVQ